MQYCPHCKDESLTLFNEWKYSRYIVKSYICNSCGFHFRAYFNKGTLSHIIASNTQTSITLITDYLSIHDTANEEELAQALKLPIQQVKLVLQQLEKKGIIELVK